MFSLAVILKNGQQFRVFKSFYTDDGDVTLHVLRAAAKNHPELEGPLKQQERRASGRGFTTGTVYAIKYGQAAGETFCIGHPDHDTLGWAYGTTYCKV